MNEPSLSPLPNTVPSANARFSLIQNWIESGLYKIKEDVFWKIQTPMMNIELRITERLKQQIRS